MHTVWNTAILQVPPRMIETTKSGSVKLKNTLTKGGSIAKSQNQPAFQIMPSPNNHFNIIHQGNKKSLDKLKEDKKEETKLKKEYKKRVNLVNKARDYNATRSSPVEIPVERESQPYSLTRMTQPKQILLLTDSNLPDLSKRKGSKKPKKPTKKELREEEARKFEEAHKKKSAETKEFLAQRAQRAIIKKEYTGQPELRKRDKMSFQTEPRELN